MKTTVRENDVEALVGVAVVIVAIWFALFAWNRTGGGSAANAIHVTALFPNASGVNVGTDVRVAGLKIGSVANQALDPQSYQVAVTLAIDPKVKLPTDTSAAITSEGLLGSTFIALQPGGSTTMLADGATIVDTQGSVDLMGLIGQFINRPSGSSDSADTGADSGAAPAP